MTSIDLSIENIDSNSVTRFKQACQLAEKFKNEVPKTVNFLIGTFILLLESYSYEELSDPKLWKIYYETMDDITENISGFDRLFMTSLFKDPEAMKKKIGVGLYEKVKNVAEERKTTTLAIFTTVYKKMFRYDSDVETNWNGYKYLYIENLEEYIEDEDYSDDEVIEKAKNTKEIELTADPKTIPGYLVIDFRNTFFVINKAATIAYCTYDKIKKEVRLLTDEDKKKVEKTSLSASLDDFEFNKIHWSLLNFEKK